MTTPFLKWPGGKRWAAPRIVELIAPRLKGTYYEPFLGSGAVFFRLCPAKAVLSDVNPDLVQTYLAVQRDPLRVLRLLKELKVTKKDYYRIRATIPRGVIQRTARFLYLNRTAFAGIYRLNQKGQFNVPYGGERTPSLLWESGVLCEASRALTGAMIKQSDFDPILQASGPGDVVYCDPTYTVMHDQNGFIRYNEKNFAWSDQERLARAARAAADRGVFVLVSNAHHKNVRALYSDACALELSRTSAVSPDPAKRRTITEYLFLLEANGSNAKTRIAGKLPKT